MPPQYPNCRSGDLVTDIGMEPCLSSAVPRRVSGEPATWIWMNRASRIAERTPDTLWAAPRGAKATDQMDHPE